MHLIISEKAIAGERIADFLADGKVTQKNIDGARAFEFSWKGEDIRLIPLRGHISDVEFPKEYSHWQSVALQKLAFAPIKYSRNAYKIINLIVNSAKDAHKIIIATDADREGESIGLEALNYSFNGNKNIEVERAYFSAITKEDITTSFSSLEKFDYNFAHSADARREIDLIWGAVLTRFISLASGQLGKNFLSIGRVQTPTLALVVDKEKERKKFIQKKFWEINAQCEKDKKFVAQHKKGKFWEKEEAEKVIDKGIKELEVIKITEKDKILKRPVPFNTTEFLRAASNINISPGKAMNIAESLYQKGFISYPRTDNKAYSKTVNLKEILNKLASVDELKDDVQKVLSQEKIVPSKGKETKDHPPIHPVMAVKKSVLSADDWKVYELVCRRFLATLYKDAKTKNLSVLMEGKEEEFISNGQTIVESGWKGIYFYSKLNEIFLPTLKKGDIVKVLKIDSIGKETQPPNRYSQSSLMKLMEKNNLGTKATRPNIIQKLYSRKYLSGNKSVEPSEIAFSVIDSLEKNCDIVTKPELTSKIEKEMDAIAAGKKDMKLVVENSRKELSSILSTLEKSKDKIRNGVRASVKNSKVLGKCNKCDGELMIRKGKSGKRFVGCSGYPNCTNSFPLPQKGNIIPTNDLCKECSSPVIKLNDKRYNFSMCINMDCKTKDEWKAKNALKKKKELNK